ncbi:hypothetical protein I3760_05G204800 [Carya illinoinensis]|nr:hypothetical protein I3760_05G204800 [Carya illinoinensis]
MSFPSNTSSSLTFSERRIDTPSSMSTFLTWHTQKTHNAMKSSLNEQLEGLKRTILTQERRLQNKYKSISQLPKMYLLFTQKITDLDGLVSVGDASVDGEVSVHEPHLVPVALGDAGDEVLDVAESSTDRRRGLPGSEPGLNLQLSLASLVSDEIKV